jgi:DnaK suppressor protein
MNDDHYRSLLGKRKTALTAVQDSGQAAAGTVELDQSRVGRLSRMDAMQSQAMHLEADRRRELELRRIDEALKRIDDGDFGYCEECGEAIAAARLEFDPSARYCIGCASKLENDPGQA